MNFTELFDFLYQLEKHNTKEWMDANRKWYTRIRNSHIQWLDHINDTLADIDPDYYDTPGKKGINRINNNLMFHPNKPIYKDHFGAGVDKAPGSADFYIEIGLKQCLFAGGYWRPDSKTLKSIREAIDYDGDEFMEIIHKKSFVDTFGALYEDQKLKNAPKGFPADHPHIEILKHKTFAVVQNLTQEEVLQKNFNERLIATYKEMLPFRRYLNRAVTV
ncbi:DUF2461 domain-containing protein [Spongiimicrobium salis]|uniref:DUF2461 domain-containing protein n=1 Tax=Spongiimicrobium salis TaxID=1667022 RepID=UPI00374CFD9F